MFTRSLCKQDSFAPSVAVGRDGDARVVCDVGEDFATICSIYGSTYAPRTLPSVKMKHPAEGSVLYGSGVAVDRIIMITLYEAMNESSVSITVSGLGGTVSGTAMPLSSLCPRVRDLSCRDGSGRGPCRQQHDRRVIVHHCEERGHISGIVKDTDGKNLVNAKVMLSNGMSTKTYVDGRFESPAFHAEASSPRW